MNKCPNWHHPHMRLLVDELGKDDAFIAYIKNGEEIPSLQIARQLLETSLDKEVRRRSTMTKRFSRTQLEGVTDDNELDMDSAFHVRGGQHLKQGLTGSTTRVETPEEKAIKEKNNEVFDRLQDISSKITTVETVKANGVITTHFENEGEQVKNHLDRDNLGISNKAIIKKGHADIKDILDRYVTKDGHLRDTPLAEDPDAGNDKVYDAMENAISKRLKDFPEGTKFIHDINIMSYAWRKAAKLDLMALTPDGKASIFSFNFVGKDSGIIMYKNEPDLSERMKEDMRKYLQETKGILKKEYGIEKFGQATAIPIYAQTIGTGTDQRITAISIDGVKSGTGVRVQVMPVGTLDTRTGDVQIDKLLDRLSALYEAKKAIKGDNVNTTLRLISKTIQSLQMKGGMNMLSRLANNTSYAVELEVKSYKANIQDMDPKDMTQADLSKYANKLNRSSVELGLYKDIDLYFKDFEKERGDDITKLEKKLFEDLKRAANRAKLALDELNKTKEDFVEKIADYYGIEGILIPEGKVGGMTALFNTFDEAPTKATRLMYKMMSNARNRYYNEARTHLDNLEDISKQLHPWLKANGNSKLLEMIKRKDSKGRYKNELVGQFKSEFYNMLRDQLDRTDTKAGIDRAKAWIKDNIDFEAYKAVLAERRNKEIKSLNAAFPDQDNSERIGQILTRYSPEGNLLKEELVKSFPHEKWHSDEYKKLLEKDNEPVLALYKFARNINDIAASVGYIDQESKKRFLPYLSKSLAEKITLGGSYSISNNILDALTVSDRDLNSTRVNRVSGEVIDVLPKYFTHENYIERTDADGNKYRDYSNNSDDLLKNLGAYMGKVLEYKEYAKLESQVQLLSFVEKNKSYLPIDRFGNVVRDADPIEGNIDNHKILQDFIQNQLYGQSYIKNEFIDSAGKDISSAWNRTAETLNKRLGFEFMSIQDEPRHLSAVKVLDSMKTYQQLKVLGINIGTSAYRFIGTNIGGFIRAGKYYSMSDFFKHEMKHGALQFYKGNAALHILLLKKFLPLDGQFQEELNHLSLNKFTRESAADFLMSFVKKAHDYVQYVNFGAMMDNAILIDGQIHNAREYTRRSEEYANRYEKNITDRKALEAEFDKKAKELVEKHGLLKLAEEKDGKLIIKGLDMDSETVAQFKNLVRHEGLRLSGNISRENESRIRMNVLTRQLLLFKNWLPGMMKTRFKGLSYVEGAQEYQWGRLRTMGSILGDGIITGCRNLVSMATASERGVAALEKLYNEKKADYEREKGTPFKMTKPEFYDMVRRNIQEEAKSISCMLLLLGIAYGIAAALKDADDDSKGGLAYAHRIIERSYEEFNLYYNPVSMENLVNGSLFPVLGLPIDIIRFMGETKNEVWGHVTGDQDMMDKAHPTKLLLKNFPVAKEIPNYIAIFAPEVAKEMGININQTQIHH